MQIVWNGRRTFNYHTYLSTEYKKEMNYPLVDKPLFAFEILSDDNSSICCLFPDFVLDTGLLLPLFFAFCVYLCYLSELLHSA